MGTLHFPVLVGEPQPLEQPRVVSHQWEQGRAGEIQSGSADITNVSDKGVASENKEAKHMHEATLASGQSRVATRRVARGWQGQRGAQLPMGGCRTSAPLASIHANGFWVCPRGGWRT